MRNGIEGERGGFAPLPLHARYISYMRPNPVLILLFFLSL